MSKALEGFRVIDFTHDQAGPACTQMLAWFGADVIKIERPGIGDRARKLWWSDREDLDSFFFLLLNSNKRSITLNLKSPEGKKIVLDLIRGADVVAESLGPGVMDRLGLGYEALSALNPRLVYASLKGFGSFGPYSQYKCFEPVAQATSGAMSVNGFADSPPLINGVGVGDSGTGMHLAIAVLGALVQRERTGKGQLVEASMQEAVLNLTRIKFTYTIADGTPLPRTGNRLPSGAYTDLLQCAGGGPDDYVYILLQPDAVESYFSLLKVIGREDLSNDERFNTPPARRRNMAELSAIIEEWTRQHDKIKVMHALAEAGVPCGAVLNTREVLADPHLRARGTIQDLEHPARGRYSMIGCPVRLSGSPVEMRSSPLLGQHTEEVLTTLAGYSPDAVERLRREKVV